MPSIISELTEEEFKGLLDEYFAPPERRMKMTEVEVKALAQVLNAKIDIPIASEMWEEKIFIKVVLKIDTFLYDNLPNEIYDLFRSLENGISDQEASRLLGRLSKLANEKINIPYLPESAEYVAIKCVLGIMLNAARKQWDFARAVDSSDEELSKLLVAAA
ncbi:hypothetical protein [Microbulbifer aggregans]|uniref:hypothetical protein n=1 Tax=Microbulbifer aggregans TaxID=1769779 RepID=UPI001CFCED09|nr:hypothetical protein [Microbulbifer aggregans]